MWFSNYDEADIFQPEVLLKFLIGPEFAGKPL